MTVSSTANKAGPFLGDGSNHTFYFSFQVQQPADVQVVTSIPGAADVVLVFGTDYTVGINTDQANSPGGSVALGTAPATGVYVTLLRSIEITQNTSLPNQGGFYPKVLESALDKLTLLIGQMNEMVGRSVSGPVTFSSNLKLPAPGAGNFLRWNLAGDGLEAVSGTGTVPGDFLQSGAGAVARSLSSKLGDFVHVRDFGALGDGSADDTAHLQAAITVAINHNRILIVDAGVYMVTGLAIAGSIAMTGNGTLKQIANTTADILSISGTSTKVVLRDLTLDQNCANQNPTSNNRIIRWSAVGTSSDAAVLDIAGVTFMNGCMADVYCPNDSSAATQEKLLINGCKFLGGQEGQSTPHGPGYISIASPIHYVIADNLFDLMRTPTAHGRIGVTAYDGYSQISTDTARGVVLGNIFNNVGRGGLDNIGCIDIYTYSRSISIVGNSMTNVFGRGIHVKADALNISIVGNVIDTVRGLVAADVAGGICVNASPYTYTNGNITISGNAVYDSSTYGITVTGKNYTTTSFNKTVAVTGNVIMTCGKPGIDIEDEENVLITGNCVSYCTIQGIALTNVRTSAVVVGNSVTHCLDSAIAVYGTVAGILSISDNMVAAGAYNGIDIRIAVSGSVTGNVIDSPTNAGMHFDGVTGCLLVSNNAINAANPFAFGTNSGIVRVENNALPTAIGFTAHTVTIAAGVIKVVLDWHYVDTEASAATDDLDTINGGYDGATVTLLAASNARDVVCKDGTGNLKLAGDFTLNNSEDSILLKYMGGFWIEVSRSDNGA